MSTISRLLSLPQPTPAEDYGFFGPDSVTWKVWSYPTSLSIGFQRAVVVEELDPALVAAVDKTHDIYNRPRTRYDRTLRYFAMVAFDDSRSTTKAADVLVKIHSKAVGEDPVTGKHYDANDPASQLWIHLTAWHSILKAYEDYGPGRLSAEEEAQYWAECRVAAELQTCDPADVPRTREGVHAYFDSMRPQLIGSDIAREAMNHLLRAEVMLPRDALAHTPRHVGRHRFPAPRNPGDNAAVDAGDVGPEHFTHARHARQARGARRLPDGQQKHQTAADAAESALPQHRGGRRARAAGGAAEVPGHHLAAPGPGAIRLRRAPRGTSRAPGTAEGPGVRRATRAERRGHHRIPTDSRHGRMSRVPARARHLGPDRRRPQVLDAALELAAQHGLAGITIAALSSHLGVSRPVVYDCYPGRGEILAALLDRETEVALGRLLAILPPLKTGSVEQMFVDGFRSLLDDVRHRPASWRIIYASDPDPILVEAITQGRSQIANQVAVVMRPLFERWQIKDLDSVLPALTEVFLGICEASVRMMLDETQSWSPEQLAPIVGSAAYRALRART